MFKFFKSSKAKRIEALKKTNEQLIFELQNSVRIIDLQKAKIDVTFEGSNRFYGDIYTLYKGIAKRKFETYQIR